MRALVLGQHPDVAVLAENLELTEWDPQRPLCPAEIIRTLVWGAPDVVVATSAVLTVDTCRALRDTSIHLPLLVVLDADADSDVVIAYLDAGADDCMKRPACPWKPRPGCVSSHASVPHTHRCCM